VVRVIIVYFRQVQEWQFYQLEQGMICHVFWVGARSIALTLIQVQSLNKFRMPILSNWTGKLSHLALGFMQ